MAEAVVMNRAEMSSDDSFSQVSISNSTEPQTCHQRSLHLSLDKSKAWCVFPVSSSPLCFSCGDCFSLISGDFGTLLIRTKIKHLVKTTLLLTKKLRKA
ncbi:hypothetical protein M8J77_013334 [Diaphorina citri]|nr:hypothetical protein M8J77_000662 [Diaphorina citri]KAI5725281.1 hypothetical protein M8J77_013334 [Diaphorina citri]